MYERFTDKARKVMQLANQEAQRFHHSYIGTEHLLLGLIKEGSGVAVAVLKNLDVELRKLRLEVEKLVQSGPPDAVPVGKLPQTPRAKRALEFSMREARSLEHNYVGTEHLLLGLLLEDEGVAAQVLKNFGLELGVVREEVLNLLGHGIRTSAKEIAPKAKIQDLPSELRHVAAELDAEFSRLESEKWAAVNDQDFEKAALLRDREVKLVRKFRDWIVSRPVDATWLSWNGGEVLSLARRINEQRCWAELPVLADALEQAGCTDRQILSHCREPGEHGSCCWVVDLLLAND